MQVQEKKMYLPIITNALMFAFFFISMQIVIHIGKLGMPVSRVINAVIGLMTLLGLSFLFMVNIIGGSFNQTGSNYFRAMIILSYIGTLLDNLSWILDGLNEYRRTNYLMNMGAYAVMPILLVAYWNYQHYVFIGESKAGDKVKIVVNALAFADCLYALIGTFTGFLFYLDENNVYTAGKGLNLIYIYPVVIVGCCVFEIIRTSISFSKKILLLSFGFVPIITVTLLIFIPEYSFVYAMFYLDLVLIYGAVENKRYMESLEKSTKISEQNRILVEQQAQIMISQIQPHFLYNTLTAIYQLCDVDTKQAQKMIRDFSVYLRANMDGIQSKELIPFEKELEHTKTYLEIELLRFSDILKVEYNIEVTDFKIPALSLQPLVENAVKYGVRSRDEGGTVTISTKRDGDKIYISVHDDGMGFDVNEKKDDGRSHTGIENTRKRLKIMMDADLLIDSQRGVGTTATITLKDMEKNDEIIIG